MVINDVKNSFFSHFKIEIEHITHLFKNIHHLKEPFRFEETIITPGLAKCEIYEDDVLKYTASKNYNYREINVATNKEMNEELNIDYITYDLDMNIISINLHRKNADFVLDIFVEKEALPELNNSIICGIDYPQSRLVVSFFENKIQMRCKTPEYESSDLTKQHMHLFECLYKSQEDKPLLFNYLLYNKPFTQEEIELIHLKHDYDVDNLKNDSKKSRQHTTKRNF